MVTNALITAFKNVFSRVIWLGDLNYRIALSYSETRKLLQENAWDTLLDKDQVVKFTINTKIIEFFWSIFTCIVGPFELGTIGYSRFLKAPLYVSNQSFCKI